MLGPAADPLALEAGQLERIERRVLQSVVALAGQGVRFGGQVHVQLIESVADGGHLTADTVDEPRYSIQSGRHGLHIGAIGLPHEQT